MTAKTNAAQCIHVISTIIGSQPKRNLFIFIPSLNEATRFGLIRSYWKKQRFKLTIDLFGACQKKSLEAKKKTLTLGMVAWIKVLLTG